MSGYLLIFILVLLPSSVLIGADAADAPLVKLTMTMDVLREIYKSGMIEADLKMGIIHSVDINDKSDAISLLNIIDGSKLNDLDVALLGRIISQGFPDIARNFIESSRINCRRDGIIIDKEIDVTLTLMLEDLKLTE